MLRFGRWFINDVIFYLIFKIMFLITWLFVCSSVIVIIIIIIDNIIIMQLIYLTFCLYTSNNLCLVLVICCIVLTRLRIMKYGYFLYNFSWKRLHYQDYFINSRITCYVTLISYLFVGKIDWPTTVHIYNLRPCF